MKGFSDLYQPNGCGDWMTPRQGLSVGMDLLDWIRFVRRAAEVIATDPDPERRILKLRRLYNKALKTAHPCWTIGRTPYMVRQIIKQAEAEIAARASSRLIQLELFMEAKR